MTTNNEIDPDFDTHDVRAFVPETPLGRTLGSIRKMFKGLFAIFLSDGNRYIKIRDIADRAEVQAGLDLKAPLHSPHFTGEPTAPTPDQDDDSDRIVTANFVQTKLAVLDDFVRNDDERLEDQRQPLSHAGTHCTDGSDPIDPLGIGAVSTNDYRLVNDRTPLPHAMTHEQDGSDPLPLGNATRAGVFTVDGNTVTAANGVLSVADGAFMPMAPAASGVLYTGFGSIWKPLSKASDTTLGITRGDGTTIRNNPDGTLSSIQGNYAGMPVAPNDGKVYGATGAEWVESGGEGNVDHAKLTPASRNLPDQHPMSSITGLEDALSGKAASSHAHSAANITSGTLPVARGGTGRTDGKAVALVTPRAINGVNFDGSADIILPDYVTTRLTGAKTLYAAPAALGAGDGSTAANAMALQTALDWQHNKNMNNQNLTIVCAAGNYSGNYTFFPGYAFRGGSVILSCEAGTVFNCAAGTALFIRGYNNSSIGWFGFFIRGNPRFANAGNYGIDARCGAYVSIDQGVTFASTGGIAYARVGPFAQLDINGTSDTRRTVTIQNTGTHPACAFYVGYNSYFDSRYVDFVITGTPAWTSFIRREGNNTFYWGDNTFTGTVGAATQKIIWTAYPLGAGHAGATTIPGIRGPNENLPPWAINPSTVANQVLRTGTADSNPAWGKVNLATDVTGVLPVANGGTEVAGAFSKAANGYCKLPGGIIIQWGSFVGTSDNNWHEFAMTFPIAFPSVCRSIQLLSHNSWSTNTEGSRARALSNTGATFYVFGTSRYYWLAIGY